MQGTDEGVRQENIRLHAEIRGLNGQLEGMSRLMAGLRARIEKLQQENAELKRGAGSVQ